MDQALWLWILCVLWDQSQLHQCSGSLSTRWRAPSSCDLKPSQHRIDPAAPWVSNMDNWIYYMLEIRHQAAFTKCPYYQFPFFISTAIHVTVPMLDWSLHHLDPSFGLMAPYSYKAYSPQTTPQISVWFSSRMDLQCSQTAQMKCHSFVEDMVCTATLNFIVAYTWQFNDNTITFCNSMAVLRGKCLYFVCFRVSKQH